MSGDRTLLHRVTLAASSFLLLGWLVQLPAVAQYYPGTPGYPMPGAGHNPTGYNPYGAVAPTYDPFGATGGATFDPAMAGQMPTGSYPSGYPPATPPFGGYPVYPQMPGAGQTGPASPFMPQAQVPGLPPTTTPGDPMLFGAPGDASFSGGAMTTPADPFAGAAGTAMMAVAPAIAVNGFKFNYNPQYGDYVNLQPRNSGRWAQFPITLHLTFPEGMAANQKETVKTAVAEWQKVVQIELVDQPDRANIELTWSSELDNSAELGETEFKASHPDGMGRTYFDKAIIRMLDPSKYVGLKPGALKVAVLHQVGHALGISSHSDNDRDLMSEPAMKTVKSRVVRQAMRKITENTIGQFLGIGGVADDDASQAAARRPLVAKIGKRDLNTLYRLYTQNQF